MNRYFFGYLISSICVIDPVLGGREERATELVTNARTIMGDLMNKRTWFNACEGAAHWDPNEAVQNDGKVTCQQESENVHASREKIELSLDFYIRNIEKVLKNFNDVILKTNKVKSKAKGSFQK
jgi:hypothetical protein